MNRIAGSARNSSDMRGACVNVLMPRRPRNRRHQLQAARSPALAVREEGSQTSVERCPPQDSLITRNQVPSAITKYAPIETNELAVTGDCANVASLQPLPPLFRNCLQLVQWRTDWKRAPSNLCKKELSGRSSAKGLHWYPKRALLVKLTLLFDKLSLFVLKVPPDFETNFQRPAPRTTCWPVTAWWPREQPSAISPQN